MDRALRWGAAIGLLISGAIHLDLYFDGYRSVPDVWLGRSFLANAIGSAVVAAGLVVWRTRWSALGGLVVANSTLVAFALSRSDRGVFGFNERGFEPSPQAALSVLALITAGVLCTSAVARGGRA